MEDEERRRKKLKHIAAGDKASETKGSAERSRAAKADAGTKKHGKDDAQNHTQKTQCQGNSTGADPPWGSGPGPAEVISHAKAIGPTILGLYGRL